MPWYDRSSKRLRHLVYQPTNLPQGQDRESPEKSSTYSIPGAELQRCHCGCKLHSLKCEKRKTNSGRKSGTVSVCLGNGCTTLYHQSAPIAMLMSCATKIMYHSLNDGLKDLINLFFQQWRLTPSPCNQANLSVWFHWCIYIYIYTKITVWCEDEERSIPLKVERK